MPAPPVLSISEEFLSSDDGLKLFMRAWRPQRRMRALLVVVHGFNSHSGYYDAMAQQAARSGIAVYAADLRGRGRSEGRRFYVSRFEDYVGDLHCLLEHLRERESGVPIFLFGHSAGGVIACSYALEYSHGIAGLLCESLALEIPVPSAASMLIQWLGRLVPLLPMLTLRNGDFTRDSHVLERMDHDDLIKGERQPARTVAQMLGASARVRRSLAQLVTPLLVMHGSADRVTRPSGSELLYRCAGSTDKTYQLYEGYYHDLLNDAGGERAMGDVLRWIDERVST